MEGGVPAGEAALSDRPSNALPEEGFLSSSSTDYWRRPGQQPPHLGVLQAPRPTRLVVERQFAGLDIAIPPGGWPFGIFIMTFFMLVFLVGWNSVWLSAAFLVKGIVALLFLPFIASGIWMLWFFGLHVYRMLNSRTHIFIGRENYEIEHFIGTTLSSSYTGRTGNISAVRLRKILSDDISERYSTSCEIEEAGSTQIFGEDLSQWEQEWLLREITSFLMQTQNPSAVTATPAVAYRNPSNGEGTDRQNEAPFPPDWIPTPTAR